MELLQQVYDLAYFEKSQRPFVGRKQDIWALDMRVPLSRSEFLKPIALYMLDALDVAGVHQVAGRGFGAYGLVGAMAALGTGITAAFVRDEPKTYGFGELIEGPLQADQPVALVDDLLNTGTSAVRTATLLRERGFRVDRIHVVFRYSWNLNASILPSAGLGCSPMAIIRRQR